MVWYPSYFFKYCTQETIREICCLKYCYPDLTLSYESELKTMLSTNYILVQKGNVAEIDLLSRNEKDIVDTYSVIRHVSCSNSYQPFKLSARTAINHTSCLLEQLLTIQAVCSGAWTNTTASNCTQLVCHKLNENIVKESEDFKIKLSVTCNFHWSLTELYQITHFRPKL